MIIKDIYKELHNIEDRIYNKEDKQSVLDDINKVHYDIMQLPFYKLFIEVIRLYEKENFTNEAALTSSKYVNLLNLLIELKEYVK